MIGIFDSGIGGLSILRKLKMFLPYEDIYYYADNKNAPYGTKTKAEIKKLTLAAIQKMQQKGCDIIVLACNTATTAGIDYYRQHPSVNSHLIGVVPVIKTAVKMTENKKIALLATPFTVKSKYLDKLIKKYTHTEKVKKIACAHWVKMIEEDKISDTKIKKCVSQIKDEDTIILGCTHFSLIKGHIQRLVGPEKTVISSNDAVARHVMRVGLKYKLLYNKKRKPRYLFASSGNRNKLKKAVAKYISC